jgi:hypothetical protein
MAVLLVGRSAAVLFLSAASPQHMMIGPANRGDATREQLKGD